MKNSPDRFNLDNVDAYAHWRDKKRAAYPITAERLVVDIENAHRVTDQELTQLQSRLVDFNMVVYRSPDLSENKDIPRHLGALIGLLTLDSNIGADENSVSEIKVKQSGVHQRYIPYTSNKLNWHTDGYYNRLSRQIRAMTLHCVRPAASGGRNELIDHEMAYIYLRDLNPEYIRALSVADVMTIPANEVDGVVTRAAQTGPVFSVDVAGNLHMRYTARKRHIMWTDTPIVRAAVEALESLFEVDNPYLVSLKLSAGEGVICNNVLHCRTPFEDDAQAPRLLYRLRYYERCDTQ